MKRKTKNYWVFKHHEEKTVYIYGRKPNWNIINTSCRRPKGEWLFPGDDKVYYQRINHEVFTKLTGIKIKDGKEGLIKLDEKILYWVLKIKEE